MPVYRTPGVYYETADTAGVPSGLSPARVDVCGFVGVCERGPLGAPVRLTTWAQFTTVFGQFTPAGLVAYAVKGFFDNGGRTCYVTRVAAPPVTLAPAGAQPADRQSSVVSPPDALVAGAVVTVTQGTVAHDHLVVEADPSTGTVRWDRELSAEFDLTAPVSLETGAAAATAVLPGLTVMAASPGAWGGMLAVGVSRTAGAATTTIGPQPSSRQFCYVAGTAGLTPGTLVRLAQGDPALVTQRLVTSVDPVARRIGWDLPLDAGYDLTLPIVLEAEAVTLSVESAGTLAEVHTGLSLRLDHPRYAVAVLAAESALIRATVTATGPYDLPAPGSPIPLRGGRDGTAGLRLADVLDGLRAYEVVGEVAILAVPDLVAESVTPSVHAPVVPPPVDPCCPAPAAPPAPPVPHDPALAEGRRAFSALDLQVGQEALVAQGERTDTLALLDPPRAIGADLPALLNWRAAFDSSYAATYTPWIRMADPPRVVPPSGHVAGVIGRVEAARGPGAAPANEVLAAAVELDGELDGVAQGLLNPDGVNCLRALPGRGLRVYGARTAAGPGGVFLLNVRRLLLAMTRTLRAELQWAVFEPAGPELVRLLVTSVTGYLTGLWSAGALAGGVPEEAFFVLIPPDGYDGALTVEIGVAPVLPAEFVVLRIGRTEAALEVTEVARD